MVTLYYNSCGIGCKLYQGKLKCVVSYRKCFIRYLIEVTGALLNGLAEALVYLSCQRLLRGSGSQEKVDSLSEHYTAGEEPCTREKRSSYQVVYPVSIQALNDSF